MPAPPDAKAEVDVPPPANACLTWFKSLTSVQLDPFHNSVLAVVGGIVPPYDKAAVDVPAPAFLYAAVFKAGVAVQAEPFQDSESATSPPLVAPQKLNQLL